MIGIGVHHGLDIGGDALAQRHRHGGRAEQADQPVNGQRREAGLRTVGTSGIAAARAVLVTASILILPA